MYLELATKIFMARSLLEAAWFRTDGASRIMPLPLAAVRTRSLTPWQSTRSYPSIRPGGHFSFVHDVMTDGGNNTDRNIIQDLSRLISQQYFPLTTNQHQSLSTSQDQTSINHIYHNLCNTKRSYVPDGTMKANQKPPEIWINSWRILANLITTTQAPTVSRLTFTRIILCLISQVSHN